MKRTGSEAIFILFQTYICFYDTVYQILLSDKLDDNSINL